MQGVDNLFEVDTIRAILDYVCAKAKVDYGRDEKTDMAIRVITDHIRSTVNDDQRRHHPVQRRPRLCPAPPAAPRRPFRPPARHRQGRSCTMSAPIVIRESASAYPDLAERQDYIVKVIRTEEERFAETIHRALPSSTDDRPGPQ